MSYGTRSGRRSVSTESSPLGPDACALAEVTQCSHTAAEPKARAEHLNAGHGDFFEQHNLFAEGIVSYILAYESKRKRDSIMYCQCGTFVESSAKAREHHKAQGCHLLEEHVSTICRIADNNDSFLPHFVSDITVEEISCEGNLDTWSILNQEYKSKDYGHTARMPRRTDTNVCFHASISATTEAADILALKDKLSPMATGIAFSRGKAVDYGNNGVLAEEPCLIAYAEFTTQFAWSTRILPRLGQSCTKKTNQKHVRYFSS